MSPTDDHSAADHGNLDQVFGALNRAPRRRVLSALARRDSRDVRAFEPDDFVPEGRDRDSFVVELHHSHLPHLDAAGFVDWDRESGTVERGPDFGEIRPLLELLDEHRDELPAEWP